jgi:hypothetical protein
MGKIRRAGFFLSLSLFLSTRRGSEQMNEEARGVLKIQHKKENMR